MGIRLASRRSEKATDTDNCHSQLTPSRHFDTVSPADRARKFVGVIVDSSWGGIMVEFFRGWRRKIGVLMLVLACAFMAGWVRSSSLQDVVTFQSGTHAAEYIISLNGKLVLERLQTGGPSKTDLKWFTNKLPIRFGSLDSPEVRWQYKWNGFGKGEMPVDLISGTRTSLWTIPYWAITTPLTLLSIWFLLSRPRQPNFKSPNIERDSEGLG